MAVRRIAGIVSVLGVMLMTGAAQAQSAADGPLYNAEDLMFLKHMSVHHQQAVVMSDLAPERTEREAFLRFTRYVKRAQKREIAAMQSLLDLGAKRGLTVPDHGPHGDPPMPGMLSQAVMDALRDSESDEFVRRWLQGMIFHHEGGLAMAKVQQLQQLKHGRKPYLLESLVEEIIVVQRAEVTKMQRWLHEWALVAKNDTTDRRAPAGGVSSPTPGATVAAGRAITILGTAIDDRDIAGARVAIQNLDTQEWWQKDGTWGTRQLHPATLERSGTSSMAWTFEWTPPAPGRYGVIVKVEDTAGKTAFSRKMREFAVR